jgi:thiosulfate/3-mercaptopyruvate sulfurtransferase
MHARSRSLLAAAGLLASVSVAQGQRPGAPLLITPAELARDVSDPGLVVLHVGPREEYDAGHIAGAHFVQLQDVAAPRAADRPVLELPDEAALRQKLEGYGISDDSRVVVVFGADWVSPATRVVFTLQAAGLGARTQFLDGGMGAWRRAGLPVTKDVPPAATPGRLTAAQDRSMVVDHAWVTARLRSSGFHLIDARAPMFYSGAGMPEHGHGAGHIPGARNLPFNTLTDDSLRVLPRETLRQLFRDAGIQPGEEVVAYCHIGQQATVVVLAARLLGHPVRLYDGSFTDWEARKLPVENDKPAK